jgi:hypothetical protein
VSRLLGDRRHAGPQCGWQLQIFRLTSQPPAECAPADWHEEQQKKQVLFCDCKVTPLLCGSIHVQVMCMCFCSQPYTDPHGCSTGPRKHERGSRSKIISIVPFTPFYCDDFSSSRLVGAEAQGSLDFPRPTCRLGSPPTSGGEGEGQQTHRKSGYDLL